MAIVVKIWQEEKQRGLKESPKTLLSVNSGWLVIAILLLWIGWFGFNPGSVLAFNDEALVVVLTTFIAAVSSFISTMAIQYLLTKKDQSLPYAINGILMGLIVITPLAGFVCPASSAILGLLGGAVFIIGEKYFSRLKWFSDPIGLFPGHLLGGTFGVAMIAFFTQKSFAIASGNGTLPNGLLFGGGLAALQQFGLEMFAVVIVLIVVFLLSYVTLWLIGLALHGIITDYTLSNEDENTLAKPSSHIQSSISSD